MNTAADILSVKQRKLITISASSPIREAIEKMNEHKVGAMLVTDVTDKIVGIWTERDLIQDILMENFDVQHAVIGDYMTTTLHAAPIDATIQELKEIHLRLFIRHILIEKDGEYVGMLSVGDIIRASLIAQDKHIEELRAHTSWSYYESWGWEPA